MKGTLQTMGDEPHTCSSTTGALGQSTVAPPAGTASGQVQELRRTEAASRQDLWDAWLPFAQRVRPLAAQLRDGEDSLQEVLASLVRRRISPGGLDNPSAFLATSLRNHAVDMAKQAARRREVPLHDALTSSRSEAAPTTSHACASPWAGMAGALGARERQVLDLWLASMPKKQIARLLCIDRRQVHRSLAKCAFALLQSHPDVANKSRPPGSS